MARTWRTILGFAGLAAGVTALFAAVALAALQPVDGLAWVTTPALAPDLGLDSGLRTRPLNARIVGEAVRDRTLIGMTGAGSGPVVNPILTATQPGQTGGGIPSTRPTATPAPTPTPKARPTPTPTPAPASFRITWATENVSRNPRNGRCSSMTITTSGWFFTNGVGGTVTYEWIRTDSSGMRTAITEPPITIAAGDRNLHLVKSDQWTPAYSGSEQLVFLSPAYTVPAQSWSCVG